MRDLYLSIDVGTGGMRSALVDRQGRIAAFAIKEHEQIVPQFGWSEQRPTDWWTGTLDTVRQVLGQVENAAARVAAICACGQMHGSVLVDSEGRLTLDAVPLWNDKRSQPQVDAFAARVPKEHSLGLAANLPAPAWPAFKLAWIRENRRDAFERTQTLLMPKDWINFRLTGERAQDFTEASLSFLMDWRSRVWSDELCALNDVPRRLLPELRRPGDVLAGLSPQAAKEIGLAEGIPVLVGAGDYPMALLGSGVMQPGMGSDVTGTSSIITLLQEKPVLDHDVANVLTPNGVWGVMTLVDAGGDAVRWTRRAFHEKRLSYSELDELATRAPAGSNALFFLPYLSGERVAEKPNSRAQFFGLKAEHQLSDLQRAVLEGVAFSVRLKLDRLATGTGRPERIVAASGGARSALWLKIKAAMYNVPYVLPEEAECGVVGAAILMAASAGDAPDISTAVDRMVRYGPVISPDPRWVERYDRMMPVYSRLYEASKSFYDDLDAI